MIRDLLAPLIADWPNAYRLMAVAMVVAILILVRYFSLTAVGFGVGMLVNWLAPWRRLQPQGFTRAQIVREIGYSMLSVLTFTVVIGIIILMTSAGWTQIYRDPAEYGWVWFWLQIPIALLIQDFYFYWMHRAVHAPGLYETAHRTHHLSTNPSAFSAFAFHPIEAFLEIAIFVVIVAVMPMNTTALFIVGFFSLVYNIYGHLGYEVMPRFIGRSPLGYLLNKSAYHNQHHRTYRFNYGLYTVIWDRVFGTLHPHAEQLYDQATQPPPPDRR